MQRKVKQLEVSIDYNSSLNFGDSMIPFLNHSWSRFLAREWHLEPQCHSLRSQRRDSENFTAAICQQQTASIIMCSKFSFNRTFRIEIGQASELVRFRKDVTLFLESLADQYHQAVHCEPLFGPLSELLTPRTRNAFNKKAFHTSNKSSVKFNISI